MQCECIQYMYNYIDLRYLDLHFAADGNVQYRQHYERQVVPDLVPDNNWEHHMLRLSSG